MGYFNEVVGLKNLGWLQQKGFGIELENWLRMWSELLKKIERKTQNIFFAKCFLIVGK